MTSYVTPKKNAAFVFYIALEDQANPGLFKASATLASGDVKVAIDDGAPANLATLPAVDADFTKRVKVSMSADEMNGDNITVIFSDAAGAEWYDLAVNIQTSARQVDDLATPTNITAGTITTVTTLTGHTPQSGDSYARLGAPAGASVSADIAAIKAETAAILVDTGTTLPGLIAAGTGSGAISFPVTINDEDSNPIDGVEVWVSTDSAGTSVVAGTLSTDALGVATFMLDAGTYYLWRQKSGYNFVNPVTIVVS